MHHSSEQNESDCEQSGPCWIMLSLQQPFVCGKMLRPKLGLWPKFSRTHHSSAGISQC